MNKDADATDSDEESDGLHEQDFGRKFQLEAKEHK